MNATPTTHNASATLTPAKQTPKSTYETPEERAVKHVIIVRQSSLANAIALAAASSKTKTTVDEVIEVAKQFEAYVLGTNQPTPEAEVNAMKALIDLTDDIPE